MDSSQKLIELLKAIAEQLPSLITLLACMVFAASRWRRHPKVSLTVLIALALLFLHGIIFAIIYNWVPDLFIPMPTFATVEWVRRVYLVLGLFYNAVLAGIFVILLIGIFMQRNQTIGASSVA